MTHRGLLERVVANLVENAAKHTSAGCVDVHARATSRAVVLEVRDTGSGISEVTEERAFDRFYRGELRSADGFGLGLSIADQAAAALGGELTIKSRRGGGTVARLELPIDRSRVGDE